MPLARIITHTPQDVAAAADHLLSRGYAVEIVSPGEFRLNPAALELNLQECPPSEALARAQALVESGCGAPPATTEASPAPPPAPPQKARVPVAFDITGRPVEFADDEEGKEEVVEGGSPRLSNMRRMLLSILRRGGAELVAGLVEGWNWASTPFRRFRWLRAERRAQRLEVRLERERERARLAALREARIEAEREAARQEQLHQLTPLESTPGATPRAVNGNLKMPAPPADTASQTAAQRGPTHGRLAPMRRHGKSITISRTAVAAAFGASAIVLLGFVTYANRRPPSPLSPGDLINNGSIKQDMPFGAATITPPTVVPKSSPVVPAKASPAIRHAVRKSQGNRHTGRRLRPRSQNDPMGEDEVVVRHVQAPRPQPQPSTAKLKRYSDMD